jgi:hypothetical protein
MKFVTQKQEKKDTLQKLDERIQQQAAEEETTSVVLHSRAPIISKATYINRTALIIPYFAKASTIVRFKPKGYSFVPI